MLHRRFKVLSVASLVLCLAAGVMWGRSYLRYDAWSWGTASGRAGIESYRGKIGMGWVRVSSATLATIPRGHIFESVPADQAAKFTVRPTWSFAGFAGTRIYRFGGIEIRDFRIPYWLLVLVTSLLPIRLLLIRPTPGPGCCPGCGYDLRASRERCPECGKPVVMQSE